MKWPSLMFGAPMTDSSVANMIWLEGFTEALRRGELPPRWLPAAYEGLGAPTFYFYPPLVFYLAGVLDALAGWRMDGGALTVALGLVFRFGAGLPMFAWLRPRTTPWWALAGAVLYQAAPYHVMDYHLRGALADAPPTRSSRS